MSISGLVVTLSDDRAADTALASLAADPRLTIGEQFGRRLAIVAETPGVASDRELWDELRGTSGITNVDVTFVHLDPVPGETHNPGRERSAEVDHANP